MLSSFSPSLLATYDAALTDNPKCITTPRGRLQARAWSLLITLRVAVAVARAERDASDMAAVEG